MCKYTEAVCITVNKSKITFVNFKQTMKHLKLQQFVYFNKRIQYLILFYIIKQVINIYNTALSQYIRRPSVWFS